MSRDACRFTGRLTISINCFLQRHQVRRDVGILVAERPRMNAGNEETGRNEIQHAAVADHRHVEVARAGTVGIEGAPSFQRSPVTALPRMITVVPGGTNSSSVRQNVAVAVGSPPNASRITLSRFASSESPPCRISVAAGSVHETDVLKDRSALRRSARQPYG